MRARVMLCCDFSELQGLFQLLLPILSRRGGRITEPAYKPESTAGACLCASRRVGPWRRRNDPAPMDVGKKYDRP